MPKKLNAFALKNFDGKRILQRPYFRELGLPQVDDTEILNGLKFCDDDSLSELEQKLDTLNKILNGLSAFSEWIRKNNERHGKYLKKFFISHFKRYKGKDFPAILEKMQSGEILVDEKFQNILAREKNLNFYYSCEIAGAIDDLYYDIGILEDELEIRLQEVYRRNFATRLKKARIKAGLSRQQLGAVIKLSPNGIGQYEIGRREPSITSLIRLARKLNVSVDWLIGATP